MKIGNKHPGCHVVYVATATGSKRDLHLELEDLEEGSYYVYVDFDWTSRPFDFSITSYGAAKGRFSEPAVKKYQKKSDILNQVFKSKALLGHESVNISEQSEDTAGVTRYSDFSGKDGYAFIYIQNDNEEAQDYYEKCTFGMFEGLEIQGTNSPVFYFEQNSSEKSTYDVRIAAGQDQVILIKVGGSGYQMDMGLQYIMLQNGETFSFEDLPEAPPEEPVEEPVEEVVEEDEDQGGEEEAEDEVVDEEQEPLVPDEEAEAEQVEAVEEEEAAQPDEEGGFLMDTINVVAGIVEKFDQDAEAGDEEVEVEVSEQVDSEVVEEEIQKAKTIAFEALDLTIEEAYTQITQTGERFTDEFYPPNDHSLRGDDESKFEGVTWIRASEIEELNDSEGRLEVFKDDITPNDVRQGQIGNCYFLSAISMLAEKPQRVMDVIQTHSGRVNASGVWSVRLFKNGIP